MQKTSLSKVKQDLRVAEQSLVRTQDELVLSQQQLAETKSDLAATRADLSSARSDLSAVQTNLGRFRDYADACATAFDGSKEAMGDVLRATQANQVGDYASGLFWLELALDAIDRVQPEIRTCNTGLGVSLAAL
jgi:chromosome segregation ATPase